MLTNEQRAHDLALLMVQFKLTPEYLASERMKAIGQESLNIQVDDWYFDAYELALDAVNKRLPK